MRLNFVFMQRIQHTKCANMERDFYLDIYTILNRIELTI